jgi:aminobenzoyl-glutamate utilization protein B
MGLCLRAAALSIFLLAPGALHADTGPLQKAANATTRPLHAQAVALVGKQEADMVRLSNEVWAFAETALREARSSKLLADHAEAHGFTVERGVAGMPTAFVASYGDARPVIGVIGEYDALPGISQKASPVKEPLVEGAAGHGCGHNLFGAASMGAAIAIKQMIADGTLEGSVRYYGTPAEESVGGKVYMARDGVFRGVDVMLAWHPSDENRADTEGSQAIVDLAVEFRGRASHAAFDPWNGRSAVDALELLTHGLNLMREHVRPTARIHYTIVKGGDVPNVIPEYAKLWVWLRDSTRTRVDEMLERVRVMTDGAARMAGVEGSMTVQAGDYEFLVNMTGARLLQKNMEWLGPLQFSDEEQAFARRIQQATGVETAGLKAALEPFNEKPGEPPGGSTDVADVSWIVPTLHFSVTTAPAGAPWHGWPVVATGGMSIGHKGMMYAAKVLAATMVDLFVNAETRRAISAEFDEKTRGFEYKPYIPPGPPPVPVTE